MASGELSVCVIDDDASVLRAVRRLLRAAGFAVRTFASAEDFLDSRDAPRPDCLVLDVHLGGVSGLGLQERLAASGRSIPIVFITAQDPPATRKRARAATAPECLRKPFDDESLIGAILRATDRTPSSC